MNNMPVDKHNEILQRVHHDLYLWLRMSQTMTKELLFGHVYVDRGICMYVFLRVYII